MRLTLVFLSLFYLVVSHASSLTERFTAFDLSVEKLFPKPVSVQEKEDWSYGRLNAWKRYSKGDSPEKMRFKGYVLFADPFHIGQKRISFLLGADCSHFVHRVFQLMGADIPFTTTRHWLALAGKETRPGNMTECEWNLFNERVEVVSSSSLQAGDVFVYATTKDSWGERGHMGFVASVQPFRVLESRYKVGYNEEQLDFAKFLEERKPLFFRYKGPLRELKNFDLKENLQLKFPEYNSGCDP